MDLCQTCRQKNAIYTCPRCGFHTCSMKCSQSHKVDKSCSGQRDKTAYVPMNKYDWGTMTNDYTYLEEVGRNATEWGRRILKDGLMSRPSGNRGGRPPRSYGVGGKKESLRLQLQARDIDMEVLPVGMERSKLNRSSYDVKTKSILLTVEILINFPKSATGGSSSIRILSHKNNLLSTLDNAVSKGLRDYVGKTNQVDPWLTEIAKPNARNDFIFLIAQISDAMSMVNLKVYHKLNPCATLQSVLKSKSFVEYPTIEVWPGGEFSGVMKDESGEILNVKAQSSKASRVENRVDKKAITSLLQDYASQDEDDRQDDVLEMLGGYNSDNEPQPGNMVEYPNTEEEIMDDEGEPAEEDIRAVLDAATQDILVPLDESLSGDENEEDWKDSEDEDSILLKALEKQTRPEKA